MASQYIAKSTWTKTRGETGFTLIELMMTLLVAAILISIAAPSFEKSVNRGVVNAPYKNLRSTLGLAKTEAITRNAQVVVCASSDQSACGNDWGDGWVAFVDTNANGTFDAAGDEMLAVNDAISDKVTLRFENNGGNALGRVTFNRQGFAGGTAGIFTFCSASEAAENETDSAKALSVLGSGVMRLLPAGGITCP